MAFTLNNWTCISASLSQGQETITPYGGSPTVENAPNIFMYGSPNDTVATISASNYFLGQYASLSVGDWIMGFGTDASFSVQVTAVSSTSVTVASTGLTTSIGTSNIVNNAVTYAKFQQVAADSLVGNPTGSLANAEGITLGNGLAFSGTTIQVPNTYLLYAQVAMTLAQWQGMYATPFQIIAAPGAGLMAIVDKVDVNFVYGSAALTGGGATGLQYGNTAHLAGPAATATEAASDYLGVSANSMFHIEGGLGVGVATASCINTAIYISNATGAYTAGTGGSFLINVWYKIVSAS